MSGEVAGLPEIVVPEGTPEDLVALGVRVNGQVTQYSWPLIGVDGFTMEVETVYSREEPVAHDVVIRFRTT